MNHSRLSAGDLGQLAARVLQAAKYDRQPGAVDAARHLVEDGADLNLGFPNRGEHLGRCKRLLCHATTLAGRRLAR